MSTAKMLEMQEMQERKAQVRDLPPTPNMTNYQPFIFGNDLKLNLEQRTQYKRDSHFVLVGTSVLSSLSRAYEIADKKNNIHPDVIIIDSSREVIDTWEKIKECCKKLSEYTSGNWIEEKIDIDGTPKNALQYFQESVFKIFNYGTCGDYWNTPMEHTFDRRALDFVKLMHSTPVEFAKIIENVVVLPQDWSDLETFKKLKTIYNNIPIVAYPSNIVPYIARFSTDLQAQIDVLRCIECLKPCVILGSDLIKRQEGGFAPSKYYVFRDHSVLALAEEMQLEQQIIENINAATVEEKVEEKAEEKAEENVVGMDVEEQPQDLTLNEEDPDSPSSNAEGMEP